MYILWRYWRLLCICQLWHLVSSLYDLQSYSLHSKFGSNFQMSGHVGYFFVPIYDINLPPLPLQSQIAMGAFAVIEQVSVSLVCCHPSRKRIALLCYFFCYCSGLPFCQLESFSASLHVCLMCRSSSIL